MNNHEYSLDWIEKETLLYLVKHHFSSAVLGDPAKARKKKTATDPTLNIIRSVVLNLSVQEVVEAEKIVAVTKTLQNAIGAFHQDVLGSVKGWSSTGSSGGVIDLVSDHPVELAGGKYVLAEIKMRYNTIKGSEKRGVWEKMDIAAKSHSHGKKSYVAYLIELVPNGKRAYDVPWKVSRTEPVEHIRAVDGVTGYYYVTGSPTALHDLMHELPFILEEAFPDTHLGRVDSLDVRSHVEAYVGAALPDSPYGLALD